jgi:hypothetical protein
VWVLAYLHAMSDLNAKNLLKVRPRVLLYTLLLASVAGVIFCLVVAWKLEHETSAKFAGEPGLRAKIDQTRKQIQNEADIEKLRSLALKYCDRTIEEWRDLGNWCHQVSGICLWASSGAATIAVSLAYALYGLRVERRTANKTLQATAALPRN